SSPGVFRGNQTTTTFDPGPLQVHRTYYWRIDEVNAYGTTAGPVWQFTTRGYKGDLDDDGDVDASDFGQFQTCLSSTTPLPGSICSRAWLAGGNGIGPADVAVFVSCLSGADIPPSAACLD